MRSTFFKPENSKLGTGWTSWLLISRIKHWTLGHAACTEPIVYCTLIISWINLKISFGTFFFTLIFVIVNSYVLFTIRSFWSRLPTWSHPWPVYTAPPDNLRSLQSSRRIDGRGAFLLFSISNIIFMFTFRIIPTISIL